MSDLVFFIGGTYREALRASRQSEIAPRFRRVRSRPESLDGIPADAEVRLVGAFASRKDARQILDVLDLARVTNIVR